MEGWKEEEKKNLVMCINGCLLVSGCCTMGFLFFHRYTFKNLLILGLLNIRNGVGVGCFCTTAASDRYCTRWIKKIHKRVVARGFLFSMSRRIYKYNWNFCVYVFFPPFFFLGCTGGIFFFFSLFSFYFTTVQFESKQEKSKTLTPHLFSLLKY